MSDRPATEPRTDAGPTTPMEALKELTEAAGVMLAAEDYQSANERRLLRAAVAAQAFIEAEAAQGAAPLPPCPICGKPDLFIGTDGKPGCPHCEVAVRLPSEGAAPRAEGLPVERLATIFYAATGQYLAGSPDQWKWIAAEYARLSRPSDERVPEEK